MLPRSHSRYFLIGTLFLLFSKTVVAANGDLLEQRPKFTGLQNTRNSRSSLAQNLNSDRRMTILYETEGMLKPGDAQLEDGSFRDVHSFVGQAGQKITITLSSPDFDTFLALIDPNDRGIEQNSDISAANTNSAIVAFKLPQSGTYEIVVNSYSPQGQGRYHLTIYDVSQGGRAPLPESQPEKTVLQAQQLMQIGTEQVATGQAEKGLKNLQQALKLFEFQADLANQGLTLLGIGSAHDALENYQSAIVAYDNALAIFRQIEDRQGERNALNNLGETYFRIGQYRQARPLLEQALELAIKDEDEVTEADALNNLGVIYDYLGKYQEAISVYQHSLGIHKKRQDRNKEGKTLNNLGGIYRNLGQYQKALDYYDLSRKIRNETGDPAGESRILNNIAEIHHFLAQQQEQLDELAIAEQKYQQALLLYQEALKLAEISGDRAGQVSIINNIGTVYSRLKQYQKEEAIYKQALAIAQEIENSGQIALLQNQLGTSAAIQGRHQEALKYYQLALITFQKADDLDNLAKVLSNIGSSLNYLNDLELAIIFFKQSVNKREGIRSNIRTLSREEQHSYKEKIAIAYQRLASLLLRQNRVMEAILVLDLLKVQELQDFFKDVKGNERTAQGIELFPQEKQILNALESNPNLNLNAYLKSASVKTLAQEINQTAPSQNLQLAAYSDLQTRLSNLGQNSVLFYPLVLDDRLELVLFTRNAPPIHKTVPISKTALEATVANFRREITNTTSNAIQKPAQQLYQWLIEPIAAELEQNSIQTLIYAPDGQMRYVPLSALYDGKQWLVEKYQVNYITALSLTELDSESFQNANILAGAFTEPSGQVNIGEKIFIFPSIPSAKAEVEALSNTFPGTRVLQDEDFNRTQINPDQMNRHNIVHLATHGQLVSGNPEESFILLNNQQHITLREIKNWQLPNVGLVVLSACQTALGEQLGSGIEIIGFGYQLQQAQARASIATLWSINDSVTSDLMNEFYTQLKQGSPNPVDALRKAQIALIRGGIEAETALNELSLGAEEVTVSPEVLRLLQEAQVTDNLEIIEDKNRGIITITPREREEIQSGSLGRLSHPYFWAPFILIGNGL